MTELMNTSLYLFPTEAIATVPAISAVSKCLQQLKILGSAFAEYHFLVGNNFFQHIIFAGCSPAMQLKPNPTNDSNFTHISWLISSGDPRLLIANRDARPRCPSCNHKLSNWKTNVLDWIAHPTQSYTCEKCHQSCSVTSLNWRHYAAYGSLLVQIHQVFPGEAVPSEQLVNALQDATEATWTYAWADKA